MTTDTEARREQFERRMNLRGWSEANIGRDGLDYSSTQLTEAWHAFQAGYAAAKAETAAAVAKERERESSANRDGRIWSLPNAWLGATVVNQEEADRDIPKLLAVPAAKRFLSIEPMLGPVNLKLPTRKWVNSRGDASCDHCCNGDRCDDPTHFSRGRPDFAPHCRCPYCRGTGKGTPLDWIIVGGASGPGARPIHPDWVRSIRDQCAAAGVPFLFRQWGEWKPMTHADLTTLPASTPMAALKLSGEFLRPFCEDDAPFARMVCVGKKAAGRVLDGRTHDGFPATQDAKEGTP